eukprot:GHUV01017642.1.p1 GENE.GHUV01017642.1~~GHUV01017642.1.p1  ORF type:complete len:481 (+),score=107.51 GHUV01017642.1:100-1542(+)
MCLIAAIGQASATNVAIGELIKDAGTLPELFDVVAKCRGSFDCANTAATFVKAANLCRGRGPPETKPMLDAVADTWGTLLCGAGLWEMSDVIWACGKLQYQNPSLWHGTLVVFVQSPVLGRAKTLDVANALHGMANIAAANEGSIPGLDRDTTVRYVKELVAQGYVRATHPTAEGVTSQHISNMVWSCAKLQVCPENHELVAFLTVMGKPAVMQGYASQQMANVLYAVSEFQRQDKEWLSPVKSLIWQKLLSDQRLQYMAGNAKSQELTNAIMALARMATGVHPVVSTEFAQHCVTLLLQGQTAQQVSKWNAQDAGNTMWSLATLGMRSQTHFLHRLSDAVQSWLPKGASKMSLSQIAWACQELGHRDPMLMSAVIKASISVLHLFNAGKGSAQQRVDINTASLTASVVASADMNHLANDARNLVSLACDVGSMGSSSASRLWGFHTWLVQKQLLNGLGLQQVLSSEQLAFCEEAAQADA